VRSVIVAMIEVLVQQPLQVLLVSHDDVVE
jgi:hypothetical protein